MLQLQKIKKGVLLLSLIMLSGCEATYTITINKDSISEKIEILDNISDTRTVTDVMDGYKKKYPVYDIEDVIDEIIDRYGSMPIEVENLIEIARIKILARKAAVLKITQKDKSILFNLDRENIKIDENVVNKLVEKYGQNLRFSAGVDSYVTLRVNEKNEKEVVEKIKEVLITIAKN